MSEHPFTPDLFARIDESDDTAFYALPRKVVHIDPPAIAALAGYFAEIVPEGGDVLDLMSSWRSHLPERPRPRCVVGLGMSAVEMADNPDLDGAVIHDCNRLPGLPFADGSFDTVLLSVSMQYLIHPIEIFREVGRVLRPGGAFAVALSHRCFPTKAVKIWRDCRTMRERMELGMAYFQYSGGFVDVHAADLRPDLRAGEDPIAVVCGRTAGGKRSEEVLGSGWRRR